VLAIETNSVFSEHHDFKSGSSLGKRRLLQHKRQAQFARDFARNSSLTVQLTFLQ